MTGAFATMDKRRLSAIMFTDIVGYTRKMGEDEVRMLRLLADHNAIIEQAAEQHEGEIVKRIGDAFLISFESALNAVLCAIDIQKGLGSYNQGKADPEQVHIRIGIHLGDIVVREGDVFGEGVNVASRVEPLAHPDGICITRSVYDLVKKRMEIKAVELGPQQLKNVDEAVEVFHLLSDTVGIRELKQAKRLKRKRRPVLIPILALVMVVALTVSMLLLGRQLLLPIGSADRFSLFSKNELADNRVAVLPLRNLTGDPANAYICEGVSEELIFRLTRVDELFVYPLTEVLALKEDRRTANGVLSALGVRYLVQGSLGLEGDSLVASIEVIQTETVDRLASQRYREAVGQHHRLHDRVVRDVLFPIVGRVSGEAEGALAAHSTTSSLAADLYLQARHAQREAVTWNDQRAALRLFESAIEADTAFALARAHLAEAYASVHGTWQSDTLWVGKARRQALRAVALSPDLPEAHYALGIAYEKDLQHGLAADEYRQAIRLRPDYRAPRNALGELYGSTSRYDEALSLFEQSLELARAFGDRSDEAEILNGIGKIHTRMREYEAALDFFNRSLAIARDIGDRRAEAHSLNNIGVVEMRNRELERALESFTASLEIKREIGDTWGESGSLNNIGATWARLGELEKSLEYYTESLALKRRIGDRRREGSTLHNIGQVHANLDHPELALQFFAESLAIKRELGDRKGEAFTLQKVGEVHHAEGRSAEAQRAWTDALEIATDVGDERRIGDLEGLLSGE